MSNINDEETEVIQDFEPPAGNVPPETGSGSAGTTPTFWKRRSTWITAGIVVVLVVAAVGGGLVWNAHAKSTAQQNCWQQVDAIRKIDRRPADKAVADALKVGKGEVADAKTWDELQTQEKSMVNLKRGPMPSCGADARVTAQAQDSAATSQLEALKQALKKLDSSANAVLGSRDSKTLKDSHDGLAAKVAQAQGLYGLSAGNVADDATRSALSQQIDAAGKLLGNKKAKASDLQGASQALDAAMNAVNASVQAKAQADAQASQAAADQQMQQSATSQWQSSGNPQPSYTSGSAATAVGSNRGWQTYRPASSGQSAPQPYRPSQPSGGSGFDLSGTTNSNCAAGHSGLCPIG